MEREQIEREQTIIYIPQDLKQKLQDLSAKQGISFNAFVTIALNKEIQNNEIFEVLNTWGNAFKEIQHGEFFEILENLVNDLAESSEELGNTN